MTGLPVTCPEEALPAAHLLMKKGCKLHVLITLGKNGALLLTRNGPSSYSEPVFVKAPQVQAVDTAVIIFSTYIFTIAVTLIVYLLTIGCRGLLPGIIGLFSSLPSRLVFGKDDCPLVSHRFS